MFNNLFGTNTNFDPGSTTSALEDAIDIRKTIDYIILKAAWEEYTLIKERDPAYDPEYPAPTPCWKALEKLEEYAGDFSRFLPEEQFLIHALINGFLLYSDVLHVLIDHHDDAESAHEMFDKYPQLHHYIPKEYDDDTHLNEVIIAIVKDYQWQLEHFADKHSAAMHDALHIDPTADADPENDINRLSDLVPDDYDQPDDELEEAPIAEDNIAQTAEVPNAETTTPERKRYGFLRPRPRKKQ